MIAYQLRDATATDADWLFSIYRSTMKSNIDATWGWDEKFQRNAFNEHLPLCDWKVICQNKQALGGFVVQEKSDHLWLEMIIVTPEFQSQGVGQAAINFCKELARQVGQPVRLSVLKISRANEFYRKHGFTQYDQNDWSYKLEWMS